MGFFAVFLTVHTLDPKQNHTRTHVYTHYTFVNPFILENNTRLQPKIQDIKITIYELSTCHS